MLNKFKELSTEKKYLLGTFIMLIAVGRRLYKAEKQLNQHEADILALIDEVKKLKETNY